MIEDQSKDNVRKLSLAEKLRDLILKSPASIEAR
jgi:hypothetical protein